MGIEIKTNTTIADKNYKPLCSGNKLPNNIKTVIVSII